MAGTVKDLKVWQEAVALAGDAIRLARTVARRESHAAPDQIILTAFAVVERIADGYSRYTTAEQREHYQSAKRELIRLESQLAVLRHADLISSADLSDLSTKAQLVHRLLGGYLVYLERQLTDPA